MKTRNEVILTGGVVRMQSTKFVTELAIATSGSGTGTYYPVVMSYDPLPKSVTELRARVTVKAHIQVHVVRQPDGKVSFFQDYIVDSIEPAKRMLADYIDGIDNRKGGVRSDENTALIFGEVTHVYTQGDNFAIVNVNVPRAEDPGKYNQCSGTCFRSQAAYAATLQKGDCVAMVGRIETRDHTGSDGKRQTTQRFVCSDIEKVDRFEDLPEKKGAKTQEVKQEEAKPEVNEKPAEEEDLTLVSPEKEEDYSTFSTGIDAQAPAEEQQEEPEEEKKRSPFSGAFTFSF